MLSLAKRHAWANPLLAIGAPLAIILVLLSASAARSDTPMTVYNQSTLPIFVYIKPSQITPWPEPMQIQPGEQKTYTLAGARVLDIRVRYYTSSNATKMVDRDARYLSVERVADKSKGESAVRASTVTSRLTSSWLLEDGRWEITGFPKNAYDWKYYAQNGSLLIVLPQDKNWTASRIPNPPARLPEVRR